MLSWACFQKRRAKDDLLSGTAAQSGGLQADDPGGGGKAGQGLAPAGISGEDSADHGVLCGLCHPVRLGVWGGEQHCGRGGSALPDGVPAGGPGHAAGPEPAGPGSCVSGAGLWPPAGQPGGAGRGTGCHCISLKHCL